MLEELSDMRNESEADNILRSILRELETYDDKRKHRIDMGIVSSPPPPPPPPEPRLINRTVYNHKLWQPVFLSDVGTTIWRKPDLSKRETVAASDKVEGFVYVDNDGNPMKWNDDDLVPPITGNSSYRRPWWIRIAEWFNFVRIIHVGDNTWGGAK